LSEDEVSYALGRRGMTRKKLARASGCIVQYVNRVAFLSGTSEERSRAQEYIKWLFRQLEGPVYVDTDNRSDSTSVHVPANCIGYITGNHRQTLSEIEDTYGTLMFFVEKRDDNQDAPEKLAIFGPERARRGAELTVMSSVEKKCPGFFTDGIQDRKASTKGFDTDRMLMPDDSCLSYALGRDGSTRKKIATASNAVLQFVGNFAHIAGNLPERQRCRDYLSWLLEQRDGKVSVDVSNRDDVSEVEVPEGLAGRLMGNHGSELRRIEQETGTFCFLASSSHQDRLLVCGHEQGSTFSDMGRTKAERLAKYLLQDRKRMRDANGTRHFTRANSRSRSPKQRFWARSGEQWRAKGRDERWQARAGDERWQSRAGDERWQARAGEERWQGRSDQNFSQAKYDVDRRPQRFSPPRASRQPQSRPLRQPQGTQMRSPTPPWRKPDAFAGRGRQPTRW